MYPPVVSVAGFSNVDRGMFRAVSNLTKELACCKKQIPLVLLRNSFKINLEICGRGLVPFRFVILVYCTETFTYISVRVFLLTDGQKLGVLETYKEFSLEECHRTKRSNRFMRTRYSVIPVR